MTNLNIKYLLAVCFFIILSCKNSNEIKIKENMPAIKNIQAQIKLFNLKGAELIAEVKNLDKQTLDLVVDLQDKCNLQTIKYYNHNEFYEYKFEDTGKYPCYHYMLYMIDLSIKEDILEYPQYADWTQKIQYYGDSWFYIRTCPNNN